MTTDQRRIAQSLAGQGYGRLYACEPSAEPNAYYVATEGARGTTPAFHAGRVFLGELTTFFDLWGTHPDRCSASAELRDALCEDSWWTPAAL